MVRSRTSINQDKDQRKKRRWSHFGPLRTEATHHSHHMDPPAAREIPKPPSYWLTDHISGNHSIEAPQNYEYTFTTWADLFPTNPNGQIRGGSDSQDKQVKQRVEKKRPPPSHTRHTDDKKVCLPPPWVTHAWLVNERYEVCDPSLKAQVIEQDGTNVRLAAITTALSLSKLKNQ